MTYIAKTWRAFLCTLVFLCFFTANAQEKQLQPIVVTANKYDENSLKIPSLVTVITKQQIEESGALTINEAIANIAGIQSRQSLSGGNELTLDLGGFGDTAQSNTVVLIDGIPLKEGDTSEIRLSGIPIEQIERVEIQRGSSSVLYGEGAVSGIIHIITQNNTNAQKNTGSVSVGYGSFNTKQIKTTATYFTNGLQVRFNATERNSDNFRQNAASENGSGSLSLDYNKDKIRIGLNLSKESLYMKTPGALTLDEFHSNPRQAQEGSILYNTYSAIKSDRYGFYIEGDVSDTLLRFNFSRRNRALDSLLTAKDEAFNLPGPPPVNYPGSSLGTGYDFGPYTANTKNDYYDLIAKKIFDTTLGSNSLIVGYEINNWDQTRDSTLFGKREFSAPFTPFTNIFSAKISASSTAYYLKNDLDIDALQTRISTGYRVEQLEKSALVTANKAFNPQGNNLALQDTLDAWEIGASKLLSSSTSVFSRYSKSYRIPNADEYTCNAINFCGFFPGSDIGLLPQISYEKELGFKYIGNKIDFNLRAYRSNLENEISYDPIQIANINLDPTQRQGLDLQAGYKISKTIRVSSAISVRDTKFMAGQFYKNAVPMAPKEILSLKADFDLSNKNMVSIIWRHISEQYIAGDFTNQNSMPSYSLTDVRYSVSFYDLDISMTVKNLFDKSYFSYATMNSGSYAVYPDQGRSYFVNIRHKF